MERGRPGLTVKGCAALAMLALGIAACAVPAPERASLPPEKAVPDACDSRTLAAAFGQLEGQVVVAQFRWREPTAKLDALSLHVRVVGAEDGQVIADLARLEGVQIQTARFLSSTTHIRPLAKDPRAHGPISATRFAIDPCGVRSFAPAP